MKKLIFILLLSGLSCVANAREKSTHIILDYDMGNQISRSGLTVLSSGLVMQKKVLMGQTIYLEDQYLSESELNSLLLQIDQASQHTFIRNDDVDASMGGLYGSAKIYTSDGFEANLYLLVENETAFKKTMVCQPGGAAEAVRLFIQTRVEVKMPLDAVPCE